jgi:hypothetical protein
VAGDFAGAQNSSRNAKIWAWVSFGIGIAGIITWIILAVVGVAVGGFLEAFDF